MSTDKEIDAATRAYDLALDNGSRRGAMIAALFAAEQVRASENKPNHGTDPTWPGPMSGED